MYLHETFFYIKLLLVVPHHATIYRYNSRNVCVRTVPLEWLEKKKKTQIRRREKCMHKHLHINKWIYDR